MLNVGILFDSNYNGITYKYTLFPLVKWHKVLREYGINVVFYSNINSPRLYNCDRIIVLNSYFGNNLTLQAHQLDVLYKLKQKIPKVIFFDITDSCGTTKFETLEIVDTYLKGQFYKDKSLYMSDVYATRSYCDFYLNNFPNIKKDCLVQATLLKPQFLPKLKIGWNIGMGDYFSNKRIFRNHNSWYCNNHFRIGHIIDHIFFPNRSEVLSWDRKIFDISYRGSKNYSIDAISASRKKIDELFDTISAKVTIKYKEKLNHKQFMDELRKSKIIISPFGYGEICFRDFEAFNSNSCLFKPDMSHLETWPNFYNDEDTYIAYKWNFSDFLEKIDSVLTDPLRQIIAKKGYDAFQYAHSNEGSIQFCNHFLNSIK